jgi:hypothetical protein
MNTYILRLPDNYVPIPLFDRDLWTAALRSGNFKQGQGRLIHNHNGEFTFCCLGVLCEVENTPRQFTRGHYNYLGNISILPDAIPQYQTFADSGAFPSHVTVDIIDKDGNTLQDNKSLTELNDNGLSFDLIADIIDQLYTNYV